MLSPDNQQLICQTFLNKNIETIRNFIDEFCKFSEQTSNHKWSRTNHYDFLPGIKVYVTKYENKDLILFNDLIEVIEILKQEKILFFKSNFNHGEIFPFFRKNGHHQPIRPYDEVIKIIKEYYAKIFVIDKEKLNTFIQKGYKTKQELNDELQIKKNKRFQIWTSLLIALLMYVLGILSEKYILNDKNAKSENKTTISKSVDSTNINSKTDSLKNISFKDSINHINQKSKINNKN